MRLAMAVDSPHKGVKGHPWAVDPPVCGDRDQLPGRVTRLLGNRRGFTERVTRPPKAPFGQFWAGDPP